MSHSPDLLHFSSKMPRSYEVHRHGALQVISRWSTFNFIGLRTMYICSTTMVRSNITGHRQRRIQRSKCEGETCSPYPLKGLDWDIAPKSCANLTFKSAHFSILWPGEDNSYSLCSTTVCTVMTLKTVESSHHPLFVASSLHIDVHTATVTFLSFCFLVFYIYFAPLYYCGSQFIYLAFPS